MWKDDPDPFVKFEPYPAGPQGLGDRALLDAEGPRPRRQGLRHAHHDGPGARRDLRAQPGFYGSTYCCGCSMHRPVGADGEFVWDGTDERVGT
jgi:hypothetical protein